ncbi:glycosyltransferase family 1 protein [Virgibacillus profundi]|uniref:Glycosyltransferase family 1 protein n=1 Tax=Virgibacillus profundi TaxID=2024555 RepID=A0A2A2IIK0_9BACI|nr:glycosyltransferase family 4 protein [Virgibacillus profundi]PAV31094.1 glycosyltransferase family 1 protein [Virgibacillus profundi]PXY55277.1 glycosyltransferase family 1 protein [Virgibacillus profundi]
MKAKKVLILVNHDVVIYNFRLELVEKLLEDGYEVFISSPYGERIDDLVNIGCKYIEATINRHGLNVYQEWKLLKYYKKIMKQIKPDVVLTYTIKPNIYGGLAAKSLRIPYIANITGLGTAVENEGIMQKVSVALYKAAFQKVSKVFFQNEENRQFFVNNKIAIGKHEVIPGSGVNLKHFNLLEYPSSSIVEFVFISRIMKEKGIEQYIEAAKYIRANYPFTKFHILGFCEGDYEEELNSLEKEDILQYHGMQRDIRKFLSTSHCTIHPTYYPEGMSNVLLESAASGRPIITTNRSGCREIVDEGINGYLVEQKNSENLIRKIEEFISLSHEQKSEMGLAGRKKVEREFDRQIVVNAYLKAIDEILINKKTTNFINER